MTEEKFYEICDKIDEIPNTITDGYFPTVAEMEAHDVKNKIDYYINLLAYYASNPYKEEMKDNEEYNNTVKYANELLLGMKFDEKKTKKRKK